MQMARNIASSCIESLPWNLIVDFEIVSQLNRVVVNTSSLNELSVPASTVAFDDKQELLWFGNEYVSGSSVRPQVHDCNRML